MMNFLKFKALLRFIAKKLKCIIINLIKSHKENIPIDRKFIITLHSIVNEKKFQPNSVIEIDINKLSEFITSKRLTGFKFVSLNEYHNYESYEKVITITIDDGYYNNLLIGLRFFEQQKIPVTIFITTEFINSSTPPWWYVLEAQCLNEKGNYGSLYGEIKHTTLIEKYAIFDYIRSIVYSNPEKLDLLLKKNSIISNNIERFLNWNELKSLASSPFVTIGAHSCTHQKLSTIKNDAELYYEINSCKSILENKLDINILHFAIPYGKRNDYDRRVINIALKCGYSYIYTTENFDTTNTFGRYNFSYDELK
ncbi:polysaccharide deacetylase family protein [Moellerella wisconsensis]|uniref:polysaccharide deacetylase family protein n=1 Tax=Moellerella wisconsensis TaxID=158849 RepID=UPI0006410D59|nr:polysaccharide deacetylase family protein [Moellerella wisconsensis]KLN95757.1 hypothetical protein VK86_13670 [Moellerella wisconsensis]